MTAPWWWYKFVERETTSSGRAMRVPTKKQRERLAALEVELTAKSGRTEAEDLLGFAVWRFLTSRDNEESDPWKGVDSMWEVFLSQADVWLIAGAEESAKWKHLGLNAPWIRS